MKRCSTALVIKEKQIKIKMQYLYTSNRLAKTWKTDNPKTNTKVVLGVEQGEHSCPAGEQGGDGRKQA